MGESAANGVRHRISVVIPCFNDGGTLWDAIESVKTQEPCEVVVVDDGSTDAPTNDVLRAVERAGIPVIHQRNHGPARARMAGLAATSAPYVFQLDADDRLLPGTLTVLADYLEDHPDISAVWGRYETFGDRVRIRRVAPELDPWTITYFHDVSQPLFRRGSVIEAGGWRLRGYEDWELLVALAEGGHTGRGVSTLIYQYRLHGRRRNAETRRQHGALRAEISALHPRLFADRSVNRKRSRAPRLIKLAIPVIDRLPFVSSLQKHFLFGAVAHIAYRLAEVQGRRSRDDDRPSSKASQRPELPPKPADRPRESLLSGSSDGVDG